jgi:hypothetical protein
MTYKKCDDSYSKHVSGSDIYEYKYGYVYGYSFKNKKKSKMDAYAELRKIYGNARLTNTFSFDKLSNTNMAKLVNLLQHNIKKKDDTKHLHNCNCSRNCNSKCGRNRNKRNCNKHYKHNEANISTE